MAIKITDAGVEFPYVFMIEQSICQRIPAHVDDPAWFTLSLVWMRYKIDADGLFVFDLDSQHSYYDENFYLTAGADAQVGNMVHYNTMTAQTVSIQQIFEQETGLTTVIE